MDRIVGLEAYGADLVMMQTLDGNGRLELAKFRSPSTQGGNRHAPANTPGRGQLPALLHPRPRGTIVELAEEIGWTGPVVTSS